MRKTLRENMLIEVYDQENNVYYKSIIQEVNPDSIAIGIPMKDRKQLFLHEGTPWTLRLVMDKAVYSFKSRLVGRKYSGRVPLYLISWPEEEEIERKQRREYFRLPVAIDLHFWVLQEGDSFSFEDSSAKKEEEPGGLNLQDPLEKLVNSLGEPEKGLAADLSGGGLLMVHSREVPAGSLVVIRLFLREKGREKAVFVKGKIIRVAAVDKKATRFRHGVQFIDLSSRVQEEIIQFVFTRAREKIR